MLLVVGLATTRSLRQWLVQGYRCICAGRNARWGGSDAVRQTADESSATQETAAAMQELTGGIPDSQEPRGSRPRVPLLAVVRAAAAELSHAEGAAAYAHAERVAVRGVLRWWQARQRARRRTATSPSPVADSTQLRAAAAVAQAQRLDSDVDDVHELPIGAVAGAVMDAVVQQELKPRLDQAKKLVSTLAVIGLTATGLIALSIA